MNHASYEFFEQTLRLSKASITRPRRLVFEALLRQKPQTLAQITNTLKNDVDRASIYRSIDLFIKLAIVHKIYIGWKYKLELTERFSSHHHHIHCRNCGKIVDIKEPPQLSTYIDRIADKTGFLISSHSFELEGTCQKCQKS